MSQLVHSKPASGGSNRGRDEHRARRRRRLARTLYVWAKTPAYLRMVADDLQSCLDAAVLEVDRRHVF